MPATDYYKVVGSAEHPHEHAPIEDSVFPFDAADLAARTRALAAANDLRIRLKSTFPRLRVVRWRDVGREL